MAFENGVNWKPIDPEKRGRHSTFDSALAAAIAELTTEHDAFFDSLPDLWDREFPGVAARPGRYEGGIIYLYVRSAAALYAQRMRLPAIKRKLATLPGAPKTLQVRLEIHASPARRAANFTGGGK